MSYEFYLINKATKEKAIVQVKTGNTTLTPQKWKSRNEKVFLFQSNGKYEGGSDGDVVCMKPSDIEKFMRANKTLLPSNISYWLDFAQNEMKL